MIWIAFWSFSALAVINDEKILLRRAVLEAQKIHVRNVALLGVDPKTCKVSDNSSLILTQISQLKTGKLNNCPEYLKEKLKALDEEIQNVEKGILVYAPLKLPEVSTVPRGRNFEDNPMEPLTEVFEATVPEAVSQQGNSVSDHTGLTEEQRRRIFDYYERNKAQYVTYDDDNLFLMLSNAYMRSLPKLMTKPSLKENQE